MATGALAAGLGEATLRFALLSQRELLGNMEVGKLLDDLDRQGVRRNTLVITTSDHGEEFGEHGYTEPGSSLHTPVIHVPLVVLPPGGPTDTRRLSRYVSLRDVAASLIVEDRWHFIRSEAGFEALNDLSSDFWERGNLAPRAERGPRLRQVRDSLKAIRRAAR